MSALRIYYVIDYYRGPTGGTERQLKALIEEMLAAGHDVRLFVLADTPFTSGGGNFPCPIECLNVTRIRSVRTAIRMWGFRRRVRKEKVDVVHAFFPDSAILVPIFCKSQSTLIVSSRRDLGYWQTPAVVSLLKLANRRVNYIVCNSLAVADSTRAREHASNDRLRVIHNACLAERSDAAKHQQSRMNGEVNICLVANIRPVKRVEDFIDAAEFLWHANPRARFWVVGDHGDDDYYLRLRQRAKRIIEGGALKFLPETDDPIELMRQCQIGVLTSESEGLSNTVMEYMACGLAVVASDVGGNRELIVHGQTGFLYQVGETEELARRLLELCSDPELSAMMGKVARERMSDFSRARMGRLHCELYRGP